MAIARPLKPRALGSREFAYVAGVFTGNGSFHNRKGVLSFALEKEILPHMSEQVKSLIDATPYVHHMSQKGYSLELGSHLLGKALMENTKGRTRVPGHIVNDRDLFECYARGLFHAGGGVRKPQKGGRHLSLLVKNESLAEQLQVYLYKFYGIHSKKYKSKQYGHSLLVFTHPQDIRAILEANLLRPSSQADMKENFSSERTVERSIEPELYEKYLQMSMQLKKPSEISEAIGIHKGAIRNWGHQSPFRTKTYVQLIDLARKHRIPLENTNPLTYYVIKGQQLVPKREIGIILARAQSKGLLPSKPLEKLQE